MSMSMETLLQLDVEALRARTARTIAAGSLALTQGRHTEARECAEGALLGLITLGAQDVKASDLIERITRLDERLSHQG